MTVLAPLLAPFREQLKANPPTDGKWHHYTVMYDGGSVTMFYDGARISQYAHWNTVLTDNEVNQLFRGASPRDVRHGNLIQYMPLQWHGH